MPYHADEIRLFSRWWKFRANSGITNRRRELAQVVSRPVVQTLAVILTIVFGETVTASSIAGPACHIDLSGQGHVEPADVDILQCYSSPDLKNTVMVKNGLITLDRSGVKSRIGEMDGGRILWNPTSQGFAIADNHGSGQTEIFSYVDLMAPKPHPSKRLTSASVRRFKATFQCRGKAAYANTILNGWTSAGQAELVVQDGVHSEGCSPPGEMIGVIGNPSTGSIARVLTAAEVRREWCSPEQRHEYGYCYDEAAMEHKFRQISPNVYEIEAHDDTRLMDAANEACPTGWQMDDRLDQTHWRIWCITDETWPHPK